MTVIRYCTPEWLEESTKHYHATPKFKKALQKLSIKMVFRVSADQELGIERDILFAAFVDKGELTKLAFISEADAKKEADYILAATPQQWGKLLRKETLFAGDVLLGRITIEQGSKPGVISLAPYSSTFIDALTQVDLQFPDEMSPDELQRYRAYVGEFRARLDV